MAFRRHYSYSSASLFLVAMAAMLYTGHGLLNLNLNLNLDLCGRADYPALCRSVVKGLKDPTVAIQSAIQQLKFEANRAKSASAAQRSKSGTGVMDVCYENYDDAVSNLETCLKSLKSHDKPTVNINLSAALTDFVTCDDAVSERGLTSPVTRTNHMLRQMASNCLYLSSLIH